MSETPFQFSRVSHDRGEVLIVHAGPRGTERIVPPAGEQYAFDRDIWARRVEISVSPKGHSVRVWVDGREVTKST